MTEERMGEIALMYIRQELQEQREKEGLSAERFLAKHGRSITDTCFNIGIEPEVGVVFAQELLHPERPPSPDLSQEERQEIALKLIQRRLREKGYHLNRNTPRVVGSTTQKLRITRKEGIEFTRSMIQWLLDYLLPVA